MMKLIAHRGTMPDNILTPSTAGSFGSGLYWANTRASAEAYIDDDEGVVATAQITLMNPFFTSADYEHHYDWESPAVEFIQKVLAADEAHAFIKQLITDDAFHFESQLQKILVERGYDGIIATYHDGSQEIITFPGAQIKLQ